MIGGPFRNDARMLGGRASALDAPWGNPNPHSEEIEGGGGGGRGGRGGGGGGGFFPRHGHMMSVTGEE